MINQQMSSKNNDDVVRICSFTSFIDLRLDRRYWQKELVCQRKAFASKKVRVPDADPSAKYNKYLLFPPVAARKLHPSTASPAGRRIDFSASAVKKFDFSPSAIKKFDFSPTAAKRFDFSQNNVKRLDFSFRSSSASVASSRKENNIDEKLRIFLLPKPTMNENTTSCDENRKSKRSILRDSEPRDQTDVKTRFADSTWNELEARIEHFVNQTAVETKDTASEEIISPSNVYKSRWIESRDWYYKYDGEPRYLRKRSPSPPYSLNLCSDE